MSNNQTWVEETKFGKWFLSTNTWCKYVLTNAIADFKQMIGSELDNVESVLDIGCGEGKALDLLHQHFGTASIIGMDIDAKLIAKANKKNNNKYTLLIANGHGIPLADNSIDAVFCHQLLHHCENQENILSEFHRILKPNGLLLVGESCKVFIQKRSVQLLFNHPDTQHSADGYASLIQNNHFQIIPNGIVKHTPFWSKWDYGFREKYGMIRSKTRPETEVLIVARKS